MSGKEPQRYLRLFLFFVDQRHGMRLHAFLPSDETELFGGRRFDRYLFGGYAHRCGQCAAHRFDVRFYLRALQAERTVHIADAVSFCGKQLDCAPQKNFAVDSLEIVRCVGNAGRYRRALLRLARRRTAHGSPRHRPNGRCNPLHARFLFRRATVLTPVPKHGHHTRVRS